MLAPQQSNEKVYRLQVLSWQLLLVSGCPRFMCGEIELIKHLCITVVGALGGLLAAGAGGGMCLATAGKVQDALLLPVVEEEVE
jgi:hypothetical protein